MNSSITPRVKGTRNNVLAFFLMILLVTVVFFYAAGFQFVDKFKSITSFLFQKLRQFFSFSSISTTPSPVPISVPISVPTSVPTSITTRIPTSPPTPLPMNIPDLEMGPEPEFEEEPEEELEIEIVKSIPPPRMNHRSLDKAIETTSSKPSTTPKATYEEWMEPIPIEEDDVPKDINGWCFIGQSKGARGCAPVGVMDKCVTGEIYVNQMECLNVHPDDAPIPPSEFSHTL